LMSNHENKVSKQELLNHVQFSYSFRHDASYSRDNRMEFLLTHKETMGCFLEKKIHLDVTAHEHQELNFGNLPMIYRPHLIP
jgi:hypothetical protein